MTWSDDSGEILRSLEKQPKALRSGRRSPDKPGGARQEIADLIRTRQGIAFMGSDDRNARRLCHASQKRWRVEDGIRKAGTAAIGGK